MLTQSCLTSMEVYEEYCRRFRLRVRTKSVPLWVAPVLFVSSRLKSDVAKRRKAYKLIHRKLLNQRFGCTPHEPCLSPTYVYPPALKQLVRTAFPHSVCDYPDPINPKVVTVTMEDLNALTQE